MAKGWLLLAAIVLLVVAVLALAGKQVTLDTGCYASVDNGCIPGKPYRVEDR